jgi:capsid protein
VDEQGQPIGRDLRMTPGMIIDGLLPGEEIGLIDSKRPNPNVVTFRQGQLRAAAAGIGASYSSISKSYDGTFSAQRQELVEQWVNYAVLADEFTGQWVQPIYQTFVQVAILSGAVKVPRDVQPGTRRRCALRGAGHAVDRSATRKRRAGSRWCAPASPARSKCCAGAA